LYDMDKMEVKTKDDFIFLGKMICDLHENPKTWKNNSLATFLDAMKSWVEDMDNYYINVEQSIPKNVSWKVFSEILMASKIYE
jgi:hypothetical protein